MNFHEISRLRKNEKTKLVIEKILAECRKNNFTVSDMKDLAVTLPKEISKAIISLEESVLF